MAECPRPEPHTGRQAKHTRPARQQRERPKADVAESLYVANLPWAATIEDVQDLFGRYGKVTEATIITNRKTGRSRGFGFVSMPGSAARTALDKLNGTPLNGRNLIVRPARSRS